MYILFREKNWKPSEYFSMDEGEKIVVHAFIEKYIEERERQAERIEKAAERAKKGRRGKRH